MPPTKSPDYETSAAEKAIRRVFFNYTIAWLIPMVGGAFGFGVWMNTMQRDISDTKRAIMEMQVDDKEYWTWRMAVNDRLSSDKFRLDSHEGRLNKLDTPR